MRGLTYRGHYIRLIPEPDKDRWDARVLVEAHAKGQVEKIHYRDHTRTFDSQAQAEAASIEFGKRMVENFIIPAYGEGDLQGDGESPSSDAGEPEGGLKGRRA